MLSRNFTKGGRVKYEFIILITLNAHSRASLADVKLRELFIAIKRDSEIFSSYARARLRTLQNAFLCSLTSVLFIALSLFLSLFISYSSDIRMRLRDY